MRERPPTHRRLAASALALVALATFPLEAGERGVAIRLIRIKGSGKAAANAKPIIEKELEPVRAQLEALPSRHARYEALGKPETKKGPNGSVHAFDLPGDRTLEVHVTELVAKGRSPGHVKMKVRILRKTEKGERAEVLSLEAKVEDDGTLIHKSDLTLEDGADLFFAITASSAQL